MTHEAQKAQADGGKAYRKGTVRDAYEAGFERGYNCASWVDVPELGAKLFTDSDGRVTVSADNVADIMQSLASEAESNDREYSPFEVTAYAFNAARNSEARWEAFDTGITDGINANLAERKVSEHYADDSDEEEVNG